MSEINSKPNVGQIPVHPAIPNTSEVSHEHKVDQSDQVSITSNLAPHPIFNQEQQIQLNELKNRAASLRSSPIQKRKELAFEILELLDIDPCLLKNLHRITHQPMAINEIMQTFVSNNGSDPESLRESLIEILRQHQNAQNSSKIGIQGKNVQDGLKRNVRRILQSNEINFSLLKDELKKILSTFEIDPKNLEKISADKQKSIFREISELFINYTPNKDLGEISQLVMQKQIADALNRGLSEGNLDTLPYQNQLPKAFLDKSRELALSSANWKSNSSARFLSKRFVLEMLKYFGINSDLIKNFQLADNMKSCLEILKIIEQADSIVGQPNSVHKRIFDIVSKACTSHHKNDAQPKLGDSKSHTQTQKGASDNNNLNDLSRFLQELEENAVENAMKTEVESGLLLKIQAQIQTNNQIAAGSTGLVRIFDVSSAKEPIEKLPNIDQNESEQSNSRMSSKEHEIYTHLCNDAVQTLLLYENSPQPDVTIKMAKEILKFVDIDPSFLDGIVSIGNFSSKESAGEAILKVIADHKLPPNFEFISQSEGAETIKAEINRLALRNDLIEMFKENLKPENFEKFNYRLEEEASQILKKVSNELLQPPATLKLASLLELSGTFSIEILRCYDTKSTWLVSTYQEPFFLKILRKITSFDVSINEPGSMKKQILSIVDEFKNLVPASTNPDDIAKAIHQTWGWRFSEHDIMWHTIRSNIR